MKKLLTKRKHYAKILMSKKKGITMDKNKKQKLIGLYSLAVALTELASTYVFATQDNRVLYALAFVLGIDAAQRLTRAFVK